MFIKSYPYSPHAIIELGIERIDPTTKKKEFIPSLSFDSWLDKSLFKSVSVELTTNQSSEVEWRFFDPDYKIANNLSKPDEVPLYVARLYLGYGVNLGEPVFKGLLTRIERNETDTLLRFYDMGFKMKIHKRAGYHNKKDDIAILKTLAERNGLLFSPPAKPLKLEPHNAVMQDGQTDWEHALERAHDAGLILFVRHDTLFARYPAITDKEHPKAVLPPDDLLRGYEFNYIAPENLESRPRVVEVRGRGRGGKRQTGKSTVNRRGRDKIILKRDVAGKHTKSKLSRRAQAQKDLEREHLFEATVRYLFPQQKLIPDVRDTVFMRGFGNLFSGYYLCDAVAYNFGAGKFEVELQLYRDVNAF